MRPTADYTTYKEGMQVAQYKVCPQCRATLDPGERCSCGEHDVPEIETAQRPPRKRPPRREDSGMDEYITRIWREFDMR